MSEIAGVFPAVDGLRPFAFLRRRTDRAERKIAAAHAAAKTTVFVVVNANGVRNVCGELFDQSVQLHIAAFDFDPVVSLFEPQMRFPFLPRHVFSLLSEMFFSSPLFFPDFHRIKIRVFVPELIQISLFGQLFIRSNPIR